MTTEMKRGRRWSPDEVAVVREKYGTTPAREIAARLGRTAEAVGLYARSVGVRAASRPTAGGHSWWLPGEDAILAEMYRAGASDPDIARRLPDRGGHSVPTAAEAAGAVRHPPGRLRLVLDRRSGRRPSAVGRRG